MSRRKSFLLISSEFALFFVESQRQCAHDDRREKGRHTIRGPRLRALAICVGFAAFHPIPAGALINVGMLDTLMANDVQVVNGLAYVAAAESGLRVVDVSDPATPVALGALNTPGNANGVAVSGGFAYVADGPAGLRVIDVSSPTAPVERGALDTPDFANDVAVAGILAYVADGFSGLRVIDVSNPAAPVEIGSLATPFGVTGVTGVAAADRLVYVADGVNLSVVDFGPEYVVEDTSIEIQIDIKPGGDGNRIVPSSNGNVEVALLSSNSFDVRDVDVTTLAFGPDGAAPRHDLTYAKTFNQHLVPAQAGPLKNLILHFSIPETGIAFGDTEACLRGKTLDGTLFEGCDSIETTGGRGRSRR
jgi:hypothetical protein